MKALLILTLLSAFSANASTYNCRAGAVKLELKTSPEIITLTVRDNQSGQFFFDGVAQDVIERNGRTDLMFETGNHSFLQLQFKSVDLNAEAETLYGFARGWYGAGFLEQSIKCQKKELI